MMNQLDEIMAQEAHENGLGPTGEFPQGPMNEQDKGGLNVGFAQSGDKIVVNFGVPVSWFAMTPDDADAIADQLHQMAHEARYYARENQL